MYVTSLPLRSSASRSRTVHLLVHTFPRSHVSAAHEADNLPRSGAVSLRPGVRQCWRQMRADGYPSASLTRVSFPGWPYFGRTTALNAAVYCQLMISIPAGRTGIRAGAGCSRKFLWIKRLSNGQNALREEQRAPAGSQHWLAALLLPVHLRKLLKNLVAQLVQTVHLPDDSDGRCPAHKGRLPHAPPQRRSGSR